MGQDRIVSSEEKESNVRSPQASPRSKAAPLGLAPQSTNERNLSNVRGGNGLPQRPATASRLDRPVPKHGSQQRRQQLVDAVLNGDYDHLSEQFRQQFVDAVLNGEYDHLSDRETTIFLQDL